jgi:hypothetical protein
MGCFQACESYPKTRRKATPSIGYKLLKTNDLQRSQF